MVSKVEGGGLPGFGIQGEKKGLSQKVEGEKVDFFLSSFGERVQNRKDKKKRKPGPSKLLGRVC